MSYLVTQEKIHQHAKKADERLMKTCFVKLCDILTHLFNLKLSRLWKMPCLVPVPKSHLTNHKP